MREGAAKAESRHVFAHAARSQNQGTANIIGADKARAGEVKRHTFRLNTLTESVTFYSNTQVTFLTLHTVLRTQVQGILSRKIFLNQAHFSG